MSNNSRGLMKMPEFKPEIKPLTAELLYSMTVLEMQQMIIDLEVHRAELEWKRETYLSSNKDRETPKDQNWLSRVNFRIGICKREKAILDKFICTKRGEDFNACFQKVAEIALDKDQYNALHAKAQNLSNVVRRENQKAADAPPHSKAA